MTHLRSRALPGDAERLFGVEFTTPFSGADDTPGEDCHSAFGTPAQIGRFQIVRRLGEGGFGVVFLATDPQLNRSVALKVPGPGVLMNAELLSRFLREGEAAAELDHPHIVPVYEAGRVGAVHYIASAYVEGMPLSHWLASRADRPGNQSSARLVAVLADAMQHAHSRGVLHRDLKPSNVLLERASADADSLEPAQLANAARVTDFGLAKLLAAESRAADTCTQAVLGTPPYMSPEQAEAHRRASVQTRIACRHAARRLRRRTGTPVETRRRHFRRLGSDLPEVPGKTARAPLCHCRGVGR